VSGVCEVEYLGRVDYAQAWELQKRLADEIGGGLRPPKLLLLEHPPTFTFGRMGQAEHLLWGPEELRRRGIQVHWVDRGGDVTYHGPGQLVGYPLLPLRPPRPPDEPNPGPAPRADYHAYLRKLEQTLVRALASLGVQAHTVAGVTGVWVRLPGPAERPCAGKIAAIGVKVDARGVTRHGFALNVNPDMEHWQGIIACGLADAAVTSLEALTGAPPAMETVRDQVIAAFGEVFEYELKLV
jgi:lipoate-protein ligase B